MRAKDVQVGQEYLVKVSGKLARVRLISVSQYGGWNGVNVASNREIRVRTAGRLRTRLEPKTDQPNYVKVLTLENVNWGV